MKLFALNKTGKLHETHTEDHLIIEQLAGNWVIASVMDGCSSGMESYFASTLYGKIIRKTCKKLPYLEKLNTDLSMDKITGSTIGRFILNQVFDDLYKTQKLLNTRIEEMLSTLILLIYNSKSKDAWINMSGDGIIVVNQTVNEIDQNNIPDYMAYHQNISFDKWLDNFSQTLEYNNCRDLSISTDGVSKFRTTTEKRQQNIDPVHYLLVDTSSMEAENMLEEKYILLTRDHGLYPYDDLGIIRIVN